MSKLEEKPITFKDIIQILMNAQRKLLFALLTQIAATLMVVSIARVWKDFLRMVLFAMVRKESFNVVMRYFSRLVDFGRSEKVTSLNLYLAQSSKALNIVVLIIVATGKYN